MHAAALLFSKLGYERTTVSDIAEAAGITASLVRHYFAHKGDIADEIVSDDAVYFQRSLDELGTFLEGAKNTPEFLQRAGERYAEWVAERHWYYAVWIADEQRFGRHPYSVADLMNRIHRFIGKRLCEMHDFKGSEDDALLAVRTLFGSIFYSQLLGLRMGLPAVTSELRGEIKRLATMVAYDIST